MKDLRGVAVHPAIPSLPPHFFFICRFSCCGSSSPASLLGSMSPASSLLMVVSQCCLPMECILGCMKAPSWTLGGAWAAGHLIPRDVKTSQGTMRKTEPPRQLIQHVWQVGEQASHPNNNKAVDAQLTGGVYPASSGSDTKANCGRGCAETSWWNRHQTPAPR